VAKRSVKLKGEVLMTRSERNARWIEEYCRVPEGKLVGKPVKLSDEQRGWLRDIYDSPTRVFILSMGRKNAKTTFSAFLLLLHLCGPEARPNSGLYSAAQSREQAAILFSLAAKIVRMSPVLSEHVGIRDSAKQLFCEELGTLYRALSAEATTAYGLSPAFTVHDELGQVRGPRSELYEALETAAAAQEEPLSVIISTQAPTDGDLLSMIIDDALTGADPRTKVRLYTAPIKLLRSEAVAQGLPFIDSKSDMEDPEVEIDPFAEVVIRLANPHFDTFMNKAEVMRQASDASRLPSREAAYRNLILNQRVEATTPFVTRSIWSNNGGDPQPLLGKEVYGGLDLSEANDLTALVLSTEDGDVEPTFWLPEDGIKERSRSDRVPYDLWAGKGLLQLTPGSAIEYAFVAKHLRWVFDNHIVIFIAFDRYHMKFLRPWLEKEGFTEDELEKFVEFGQGYVSMSPAIRELETRLLQRKFRHGNHPVLAMCAANARVVKDEAGNRKFTKSKSTGRIDGMVALAMAVGVMPTLGDGELDDFIDNPLSTTRMR
jgi:phage terminase large subunit-like protein